MKQQIDAHLAAVAALREQTDLLERISDAIVSCFRQGGRVYTFGNGGSAADAQHIAGELLGRFKIDRAAWPAVALSTDTSVMTAVSNDLGPDVVFARQVEGLVSAGDIVWALSVSGKSPNVIEAVKVARQRGATVIGFTSRRGNVLRELSDLCLQADHDDADRTQEIHLLAYHLICERVEQELAGIARPENEASVR